MGPSLASITYLKELFIQYIHFLLSIYIYICLQYNLVAILLPLHTSLVWFKILPI